MFWFLRPHSVSTETDISSVLRAVALLFPWKKRKVWVRNKRGKARSDSYIHPWAGAKSDQTKQNRKMTSKSWNVHLDVTLCNQRCDQLFHLQGPSAVLVDRREASSCSPRVPGPWSLGGFNIGMWSLVWNMRSLLWSWWRGGWGGRLPFGHVTGVWMDWTPRKKTND